MHLILLFISIAVLFPVPILYPPIASFTAYFFAKEDKLDAVALFLLYSAGIVTALIQATINPDTYPLADPSVYIRSFENIDSFDFRELALNNDGFEPLYKVYELLLSLFLGSNSKVFFLITALIINISSITAVLRICIRLGEYRLPYLIFTACYSLVAPALGVPMFLMRSGLSLSILFLGISFYSELPLLFYSLGLVSVFIHFSSFLIFGLIIFQGYGTALGEQLAKLSRKLFYTSVSGTFFSKVFLLILIIAFFVTLFSPNLTAPILTAFLSDFESGENAAATKAKSFLTAGDEKFVDFKNPVVVIQIAITFLCFIKFKAESEFFPQAKQRIFRKNYGLLAALRLIGRALISIIVITAPLNVLPFRLGFFNFMYFPLWFINLPFISLPPWAKNYSKYLVIFSLMAVIAYSFYWIPKREGGQYLVEVLENKPLKYNLVQVAQYYF